MKVIATLLILVCQFTAFAQQQLNNQDVINLIKSGLGESIVIAKIKQTGGNFDTSPASLRELKSQKISESVILAMIESVPVPSNTTPVTLKNAEIPAKYSDLLLKGGTRVELELAYTVSSAELREGEAVSFIVVHPVLVDGAIVIERGAAATARVVKAEGGKSWGRGGQLAWNIQNVTAIDGQKIPLQFSDAAKGNGAAGSVTTGIVVTGLLFWPAAPFWGFKKGKPAIIPAGKRFEVFVHGDSTITIQGEPPPKARMYRQVDQQPEIINSSRTNTCYDNGRKVPCR